MPVYDFSEKHETTVRASAAEIYRLIDTIDFSESFIIRWLLRIRGMSGTEVSLRTMERTKFKVLGEQQDEEIVIGLAGQFWAPAGNMQDVDAGNFREFDKPGYAKAAWNFSLDSGDEDSTILTTETRIRCLDDSSRSRFGFYWTFIKPFSGWIRGEMLDVIKRKAEGVQRG